VIPRRLYEHVKSHNWFAVAVDFIIVVVGVFIGLQAQEWNALRGDRAREAAHLSGIARDVRSDLSEIDEIIRVSTLRMSALNFLLQTASGKELPKGFSSARGLIKIEEAPPYVEDDPNTIGIAIFILTTLDGERATYETMINMGGLDIMRDAALLRQIQNYYANVDKARVFERALQENRVKLVDAEQEAGISPVDETPARALAEAFARDAALLAAARNYWLYTNRHLKLMKELRGEAAHLAEAIEGA
jgi:hypothetical protein